MTKTAQTKTAKPKAVKAAPESAAASAAPSPAISPAQGTTTMTDMTAKIKETAETVVTKAKAYAGEVSAKAKETAIEIGTLTKDNASAVVESGKIGVKGTTELTKENVAFAKTSFEDFTAAAKNIAAVKNPSDFVKMQGEYLRAAMDKNVEFMTKSSEAYLKLVGETIQPISTRMSVIADKIKTAA